MAITNWRIWMIGCAGLISLIMLMPGSANAYPGQGAGVDHGCLPTNPSTGDQWYQMAAQDDWSYVYIESDSQGTQTTGIALHNIEFRDYQEGREPDGYDRFFRELTIPWIYINWQNHGPKFYPFDDRNGNSEEKIMLTNVFAFTEGNLNDGSWNNGVWSPPGNPNPAPTIYTANYDLDVDNDTIVDFSFQLVYYLYVWGSPAQVANGEIQMQIIITAASWAMPNWDQGDNAIDFAFAFLCMPEMSGPEHDHIDVWNGVAWNEAVSEEGPTSSALLAGGASCANLYDDIIGHSIDMIPTFAIAPLSADLWCVLDEGNEYSKYPENYDQGDGFNGEQHVIVWYVIGFTPANYPIGGNAFTAVSFSNILA